MERLADLVLRLNDGVEFGLRCFNGEAHQRLLLRRKRCRCREDAELGERDSRINAVQMLLRRSRNMCLGL